MSSRHTKRILFSCLFIAAALMTEGCGSQRYTNLTAYNPPSSFNFGSFNTSNSSSDTAGQPPAPGATPSPTIPPVADPNLAPPYSLTVRGVGYNNIILVQVAAGRRLKVRFTPGTQDSTATGNGFTPQYSKLGVYISVNGVTRATPMLDNGLMTGTPQASPVMDFSGGLSGCTTTDCRQTVTIKITKPNYDYWCLNYGTYCPWTNVWGTHPWNGTLEVQTDDTAAL